MEKRKSAGPKVWGEGNKTVSMEENSPTGEGKKSVRLGKQNSSGRGGEKIRNRGKRRKNPSSVKSMMKPIKLGGKNLRQDVFSRRGQR